MRSPKKALIPPEQVKRAAKRREQENADFRVFLKMHADPDVLDRQFLKLHRKIFPQYDCGKCRNCCKLMHATIPACDIDRDAVCQQMTTEAFVAKYLERDAFGEWTEKHSPCGFLMPDGQCRLGECCPEGCRKFPYTDQPNRMESLYSILSAVSVCPAAFEIWEALKKIYGFAPRKSGKCHTNTAPEENGEFAFIGGYTPWGFPYGIQREDEEQEISGSEELPF